MTFVLCAIAWLISLGESNKSGALALVCFCAMVSSCTV